MSIRTTLVNEVHSGSYLRREDDGLTDHLAARVRGDLNSVAARARCATNEVVLVL